MLDSTHSSVGRNKPKNEAAQADKIMSSSTMDNPRTKSSHGKASSESVVALDGIPASREMIKSSTNQSLMDDERQTKSKCHRKGTQSAGAIIDPQKDQSFQGNALNEQNSADQKIKDLEMRLADGISKSRDMEQAYDSLKARVGKQSHIIRDLKGKLNETNLDLHDLQQDFFTLEDRNEKTIRENKELRAQWVGATEDLGRLQKTDRKHHTDDETVMAIWNNLVCTIHTLALRASASNLVAPTPDQYVKLGFVGFEKPYYEKYFPSHPSVLFEAAIWSRISSIIEAPSMIWSQDAGRAVEFVTKSIICKLLV